MPHDDGRCDKPLWPTKEVVDEWTSLKYVSVFLETFSNNLISYCPSVFILKPGQHLHINKGRLHAFRKLTIEPLPDSDCHADLRSTLIQQITDRGETLDDLCISIAYDWYVQSP